MTIVREELSGAISELAADEPNFHRPEFGTRREDFKRLVTAEFWETGASGQIYSREFVLDTLEESHRGAVIEKLTVSEFHCQRIADDHISCHVLAGSGWQTHPPSYHLAQSRNGLKISISTLDE